MNEYNKYVGQVFTPIWAVNDILDKVGYIGNTILDKKIFEPAAGNGNFVLEIIRRIIRTSKKSSERTFEIIKNNVFAIEIDQDNYINMIKNIIYVVKIELDLDISRRDIPNIKSTDTLRWKDKNEFDFIVGNPPYTPVKFLPKKTKEYVLKHYDTSLHPEADVFGPFFEMGIKHLKKGGTLGFIIPTSLFVSEKDENLRIFLGRTKRVDYKENVFTAEIKTSLVIKEKENI